MSSGPTWMFEVRYWVISGKCLADRTGTKKKSCIEIIFLFVYQSAKRILSRKLENSLSQTLLTPPPYIRFHSSIPQNIVLINNLIIHQWTHLYLNSSIFKLSEENVIKIADVGLAKPVEVIACPFPGACFYMAPEVRDSQKCDKAADIYSFGIILWEMWFKHRAYQWSKTNEEFFGWLNGGKRPDNDKRGCNEPPWNHLMIQCGNGNPKKRPTAEECKDQIKRVCSLK